jgi:hypothetical protein
VKHSVSRNQIYLKNIHFRKGGRTITVKEFKAILEDLSAKRFPKLSPTERQAAMEELVANKGPQTAGTTV